MFVICSLFCQSTLSRTLHFLHVTVQETAHGSSFLPDAEHPQFQLLEEADEAFNPLAEVLSNSQHRFLFSSKQLAITGKCSPTQRRRIT